MVKKDISIVILNYNTKDDLRSCLKSLVASADIIKEIIVVDNASADGSSEMVRRDFPDIRLISLPQNLFFNKGINAGLRQARGRYAIILNPDTKVPAKTLTVIKQFMDTHQRCAMATCRQVDLNGKTQRTACRFPTPLITAIVEIHIFNLLLRTSRLLQHHYYDNWNRRDIRQIDAGQGALIFCRRNIISKFGFFDEGFDLYYSDTDLAKRIKAAGWDFYHIGTVSITHLVARSTQRLPLPQIMRMATHDMVRYHRKHSGFIWAGIILILALFQLYAYQLFFKFKKWQKNV